MTKCVHSLHNKNKQKAIGLFHRLLFMKYGLSLLSTQREKALDIKYDDEWAYDENEHMMNEHIMNEHDEWLISAEWTDTHWTLGTGHP